jgi:hypothetical protein
MAGSVRLAPTIFTMLVYLSYGHHCRGTTVSYYYAPFLFGAGVQSESKDAHRFILLLLLLSSK